MCRRTKNEVCIGQGFQKLGREQNRHARDRKHYQAVYAGDNNSANYLAVAVITNFDGLHLKRPATCE